LTVACERTSGGLSFLVFRPGDPSGYGRVLRDADGRVTRIREHRDASPEELRVDLCNAGVYCVRAEHLHRELPRLQAANAQGEIYLTDLVERVAVHGEVEALEVDAREVAGVNTPEQLEALERARARPD
jgi:bifunctional UDP-N-acetylglucosamine pyrophosphorylase/glucosamine-1-phosphate N-acetyltransferase